MKPLSALVALSLCANLALAWLAWRAPTRLTDSVRRHADSRGAIAPARSASATTRSAPKQSDRFEGSTWAEIQSDDFHVLVARLRAAGFPAGVVSAILTRLVDQRLHTRREEISATGEDTPFWKPPPNPYNDPEKRIALRQLDRERHALLKQLLGDDYLASDEEAMFWQRQSWGNLPVEKLGRLADLFNDYSFKRESARMPGRGPIEAQREKLLALDREERAELAKILTPQELEQYDLRNGPAANQLRYSTQWFDATEAEYIALHRVLRSLGEQFPGSYREPTQEETAARQRIEEQLQLQIKAALGEERYADYIHAKSPEHFMLNRLVARLELPVAAARTVATVQTELTGRSRAIAANTTLTPDERATQLGALAREAESRITVALGARGFEAYKSYGGQWLQTLAPTPASSAPSR